MTDTNNNNQASKVERGKRSDSAACSALRIPTRPRCHRCQRYITIDTHADNDLWEEVIGDRFGPGYICADCFTRAADERLIEWEGRLKLVPISLAAQMKIQDRVSLQNDAAISLKRPEIDFGVRDDNGHMVRLGDHVCFSYGIPPVYVIARIARRNNKLVAMTPGHKPRQCRLSVLAGLVGGFQKCSSTGEIYKQNANGDTPR